MRNLPITLLLLFISGLSFCQQTIISGEYDDGLKLSYNSGTKILTGYFENYTGLDEKTNNPRFSCIFYIEGKVTGKQFKIKTYYPDNDAEDIIEGTIEILSNKSIKIKLPEEHGGCWNVLHFADEPVVFNLEKEANWKQIKCVLADRSYFYKDIIGDKKLKAYLVKGDFVCIEKIENKWVYCTFFGNKTTKGWIKRKDLN